MRSAKLDGGWSVYVIGTGESGPVKIGATQQEDHARQRRASLQVGHSDQLIVLYVASALPENIEPTVQSALRAAWRRGEWYNVTLAKAVDVIRAIASVATSNFVEKFGAAPPYAVFARSSFTMPEPFYATSAKLLTATELPRAPTPHFPVWRTVLGLIGEFRANQQDGNLGEQAAIAYGTDGVWRNTDARQAARCLRACGIKTIAAPAERDTSWQQGERLLCFANRSPTLARIFAGTPWRATPGGSAGWGAALLDAPTASRWHQPVPFPFGSSRIVVMRLDLALSGMLARDES